jgi:hypothetical protein
MVDVVKRKFHAVKAFFGVISADEILQGDNNCYSLYLGNKNSCLDDKFLSDNKITAVVSVINPKYISKRVENPF